MRATVDLPSDLADHLERANQLEAFRKLPPSHQREYIKWIEEAKKPETRRRRIEDLSARLKVPAE